ncbi:DUF3108 domain-containing protein [Rhodoferax sp.]|uniref:DUF3108 domain-containing protein n=1 Tax=Rhodoferax sp. TaxID=50421 RepID=UPI00374CE18D
MSLPKHTSTSLRPLLVIAAVVVLAHLALLETLPKALEVQAPMVVHAFNTRSISLNPPAPPAPVEKPQPAPPKRQPKPTPPPDDTTVASNALPVADVPVPAPAEVPPPPAAPAPEVAASAPVATPVVETPAPEPAPPDAPAIAFTFPGSIRLKYELSGEAKKMAYHARGELLWLQDGHNYDAKLEASMLFFGSRTRTSSGQITPTGLAPTRFADKWRSELAAHFDHDKNRVTFSANTPDVPLQPAAQDQLSVIFQVAAMLAGDPAKYPTGATLSMQTVGTKDAETWLFTVEGADKQSLPSGAMDTVKLIRNPRKEFDQKVEIWLAPSVGYLPVRLKITNANGDFVDQQLRGIEKP